MGAAWKVLFTIISLGVTDDLGEVEQTNRRAFTGASLFVGVAGPVWGAIYISLGELGPGLIPSVYSAITAISFILLWRNGGWRLFRVTQLALIFALPIALMLSLGGYGPGSGVIIWAVLAPLGSLWSGRSREAIGWSAAFLLATVAAGVVDPYLRDSNDLPDGVIIAFFVMNLAFVTSIIFLLLDFYVGQKDRMIFVISRNRELESAFLAQELTLRQNDKLATLGKLSAGMAHTGLGLNISFNIITEKHGGEIAVWSVPGRTTFTIKLPLSAPSETDRDTPTRTRPSPEPAYRGVRS